MRSKRLPLGLKKTEHTKRVKQLLIIGLSLFVIFSQLSMSPLNSALADSSSTAPNTNNQFFDSVKLTTGDPNNSTEVSTDNPLKKGEPVNLEYVWTQKNGQTLSVDKDVTVQIPTNFNFDKDAAGNVTLSDNKTVIGTYTVKASSSTANANQLTVHFNDQAAGLTNVSGKIVIPATFNANPNPGPNPMSIVFDLGNSKTQSVSVPVDQSVPGTNSSATPSASSSSVPSASPTPSAGTASPNASSGVSSGTSVKTKAFVKSLAVTAPQEITQNILTGIKLTDANGNPYDASNKATTSSPANIFFTYTIPNGLKVNDGDYYTFKLPNDFAIYNTINGNLDDGSGNQIGTFTVTTDGTVTMTFINNASNGNYFDNHSNVDGSLEVHTQFNSQTITGSTQQQITFPIHSPVTLTIPFKPSKTMDSIDKQGTPDKSINPGNINWTVNINEVENTLTNAKVTDPALTGLSLNTSSIQIYPLTVNVDGSTTVGTTPVPATDYTVQDAGGNLEIDFNHSISSAYQIQYSTAITDAGKNISSFDNKATLTSDGVSPVTADATVTNKRGDHLTKTATGYNALTQTITWTINYNGDDKSIPDGTVLHDLFDNTQDLVSNSVKVYQATVNNDGSFSQGAAVSSGYSVTSTSQTGKNGFDLTFNGNANSGAYQIVYQTKANGLVTADGTVNNSVQENATTPVDASKGVAQQGIQKYSTGSNFANKTDTWHITVNGNHYQLNNAKIIDTFDNAGLSLQNATFKIHDDTTNSDLTEGTDYTLNFDSNGFTVVFQGAYTSTSDAFTIDYTTNFNFANLTPGKTNFSNTSVLSWTDASGKSQSSTSTATFTPDSNTQSNGFKNGSYDATTKQITWNVGVNYNLATINDPVISDPITGDQQYVDGSFELHYMTLTGGANGVTVGAEVPASDYTADYPSSGNSNTLTVHFLSPITTPYYITYKTSLGGQIVNASYTNTATVKDGSSTVTTLNASVNPAHGGSFASKNGTQDGNYVDWTVNINSSQSTVSNAELDDTPTNNQIIDPNSFHLYPRTVNASGSLTTDTGNELQQGKDYTLTINTDNNTGAQTFTIKFANPIDSAYQLTYSTLINANNGDTLGNTANFSGSNIRTVTQQTSQNVTVHISSGSGSGSGVNGSLTVFKDDAVSHAALPGATFTLYDSTGKTALRTLTTGSDGKAAFNNFKYGTYILKEIQAPVGYTISNALVNGIPVTIDATSSAAGALTTIDDNQNKVILTKQDVNGNGLTGATFSLLKDGQPYPIGHAIQSVAGQVEIDGLVPGSYQLTETAAPTGYLINSTPINFTVTENANNQIPDVNLGTLTDYQGSATLTKDDNANHPLAGAVYELQMQSGDGSWSTIQQNLVTGKDGKISASGLAPGAYQFVETQAPDGYTVNGSPVGFTIASTSSGDPGTQQLSQSDSQDSVVLTKVDANNSNAKLSGAEFKLEDSSGNVVAKDAYGNSLKSVWTTDSSGQFTVNGLAPGSYQFVETAAPSGYQLDSTPVPFTVSNKDTKAVSITASDKPSAVTLTKVDANDSNAELSGAEFRLEDSSGQAVTTDAAGKTLPATWTTDSNGQFTVSGLAPGSYQFVETAAPNGYQLDQTPIPFKVTNTDTSAVPIQATDKLNSVTLTKVDANDSNAKLPGAEFKLEKSSGQVVTTDVTGKALPAVWTTDSHGQFTVNGLTPGHYQFVETAAPNGYQLDNTPIPFTITNTDVKAIPVTATDGLNAVTLTKVDFNDQNAVLAGATFKLQDSSGQSVTKDVTGKDLPAIWTTDNNGQFTVNGLAPGTYQFIETSAPSGYDLDTTPIPFRVTNTDIMAIPVLATDKLNAVTVTKVDASDTNAVLPGAEFQLQDSNGQPVTHDAKGSTLGTVWMTNASGQFTVQGLASGHYQFVETKAPNGYQLDQTPIPFTVTNTDLKAIPITATNKLNAVTLTKVDANDQNAKLPGAEFELQDSKGNVVTTDVTGKTLPTVWTTDSNGQFTVNGLSAGHYQFVETKAPNGYQLDQTPIPFTVTNTNVQAIPITAADKLNSITLTKIDANDQNAKLAGAEFQLQDSTGKTVTTDVTGQTLPTVWTTESNGQFTVNGLSAGHYQFVETKAPNGYELDATPIPFDVTNTDVKAIPITATDKLNSATLTKIDANNKNAVLAGAEFRLQDSNGNAVTKDIKGNTLTSVWTTDSSGQFTVNGLAPGSYQFIETKAPNGYQLDQTPIPFKITNTDVQAVPITATDKQNSVTLTKVDANDSNAKLPGAEFELQDSKGNAVTTDVTGKTLPTVWTTDSNGQFTVNGLSAGHYQFVETKAPNGYQLDQTPIPFTVTTTDVQTVPITATNKMNAVTLTKADVNDKNAVLQGAEFKLYDNNNVVQKDVNGKALPSIWTTNSKGQFTVNGLVPGNYHFIETKAPLNYNLDTTPIPFQVTNTDIKAILVTATDKLTPGDVQLTKVDRNDKNAVLKGAVFKLEDSSGKTLETGLTTNNSGQFIVKGLAPGKYFFVETKAPNGYQLDATPIPFTIAKGQAKAVEITATDKPLVITKQLTGKPGATYNVVDQNGHVLVRGVMADSEGHVHFKGLASGKYHLVLVRGVKGEAQTNSVKKTRNSGLPTTGDTNDIFAMMTGTVLLLGGGAVAFFTRRRRKN